MGIAFNSYQEQTWALAEYPDLGKNIIYPALGLAGEAGEAVDKIKKNYRNFGLTDGTKYTGNQKDALILELGDVLWYISAIAKELGISLEEVAAANLEKLLDRKARNVIKSEGDYR